MTNYKSSGKVLINHLIAAYIKRYSVNILNKRSQYDRSGGNIKFELDLSSYATKLVEKEQQDAPNLAAKLEEKSSKNSLSRRN